MSTGLLLISHPGIASNLLDTAVTMLGRSPLAIEILEVPFDAPIEKIKTTVKQCIHKLEQGDGVLILTDLYGATPCNIGHNQMTSSTRLVAGLNLSMLIRVLNYPQLGLDELASKAVSGGHDGILMCE
ncbi:MAG: PTS fructose transporter subunit IIA [Gammaproteobacteria bacterium]|nr:MAG: PTS fructose transporter subunit IIA [Gammaproteobacteria bacterium]